MDVNTHIGAHKTATTHFQDNLAMILRNHGSESTHYFSRESLRKDNFIKTEIAKSRFEKSLKNVIYSGRNRPWRTVLKAGSSERLLLSEENIMGVSSDILDGFYPRAAHRFSSMLDLFKGHRLSIFMSIRSYDGIFPSAYSQSLRAGKFLRPFADYWEEFNNNGRGWPEVVSEIRSASPESPIIIFKFEDYLKDPARYVAQFSGLSFPAPPEWLHPRDTVSLTDSQIKEILEEQRATRGRINKSAVSSILSKITDGERFDPLSEMEKDAARERYESDLQRLGNINGVEIL